MDVGALRSGSLLLHVSSVATRRQIIPQKNSTWSQVALAIGCVAAIVVSTTLSRPYYVSRAPLGEQIIQHVYVDSARLHAPWLQGSTELALRTPQFLRDRELFAMDLLRTGHVDKLRARTLADVAVREAYTRRVPPALVLGVMLTENDELRSSARSSVGAIGLMQVSPQPWSSALGHKFGTNIHTDSTNLKYGIFILGWVAGNALDVESRDGAWRNALLHYNGCVHGRETKTCRSYPDIVRRAVQRSARSTCGGASFDRCVVQPMWLSRKDADADTVTSMDR